MGSNAKLWRYFNSATVTNVPGTGNTVEIPVPQTAPATFFRVEVSMEEE